MTKGKQTVIIKSFFADSVAAAISQARRDLGDDAMLLESRRAREDARRLGGYEVVFGVSQMPSRKDPRGTAKDALATPLKAFQPARTPREQRHPFVAKLCEKLVAAEVDEAMAAELVELIETRLSGKDLASDRPVSGEIPSTEGPLARVVAEELDRLFPRDSTLGMDEDACSVALVGPPGGGKTSAVVRLAVSQGLAQGRRTVLLAAHDPRVGGFEKLRRYASLLNAEFRAPETFEDLSQALEDRAKDDLILIDTPGFGPKDMKLSGKLAGFLARRSDIQTHLVLPATMKRSELTRTIHRFEGFKADRLLFTRLDEAATFGTIFSEAAASRKAISYLTTGQKIPGDILVASEISVVRFLGVQDDVSALCAA